MTEKLKFSVQIGLNFHRAEKPKWRTASLLPLFLCCAVAVSSAQHDQPSRQESLRFVQPYLWLGYIGHDQSVPFSFEVKNDSDKAVKIVSCEASCRCTSPDGNAPEEIPGHGTGSFKWIFSAARSSEGFDSKEITITTADGRTLVGKFEAWAGKVDEAVDKPKARSGS